MQEMPGGWWLTHSSAHFLLAALVHKNNPDIAVDPTTVAAGGTREDQRKQVRDDRIKERELYPMFASSKHAELKESNISTLYSGIRNHARNVLFGFRDKR